MPPDYHSLWTTWTPHQGYASYSDRGSSRERTSRRSDQGLWLGHVVFIVDLWEFAEAVHFYKSCLRIITLYKLYKPSTRATPPTVTEDYRVNGWANAGNSNSLELWLSSSSLSFSFKLASHNGRTARPRQAAPCCAKMRVAIWPSRWRAARSPPSATGT